MLIEKRLIDYGFARSRVKDLAIALEAMHKALALMDSNNRALFAEQTFEQWLNKFAKTEELAEI